MRIAYTLRAADSVVVRKSDKDARAENEEKRHCDEDADSQTAARRKINDA